MFEPQESTPWYRSRVFLVAASSLLLILIGAGYFLVWRRSSANEAHYAALEQQRAQQQAEAQAEANSQAPAGTARSTGRSGSAWSFACCRSFKRNGFGTCGAKLLDKLSWTQSRRPLR